MGNAYLDERKKKEQAIFDAGEDIGTQKMWDFIQNVLRNPKYMGTDIFGKKRLKRVYQGLKEEARLYKLAFTADKEADYWQEHLDARHREVWGDELVPFKDRYPYIKEVSYKKSMKGWK